MLERVLHAKPAFFDVTPIGRIIKRFQHGKLTLVYNTQGILTGPITQIIAFLLTTFNSFCARPGK
jgi:hypothetical protein